MFTLMSVRQKLVHLPRVAGLFAHYISARFSVYTGVQIPPTAFVLAWTLTGEAVMRNVLLPKIPQIKAAPTRTDGFSLWSLVEELRFGLVHHRTYTTARTFQSCSLGCCQKRHHYSDTGDSLEGSIH